MRLTTNSTARPQSAACTAQPTNPADEDLCQIRVREQTIFLALWRLNPRRQIGVPLRELARVLSVLMDGATRNFEAEERCLRPLKPSECQAQHAAHHRIMQDLITLRALLLAEAPGGFDFDQALNEFLFHCVCNDPWVAVPKLAHPVAIRSPGHTPMRRREVHA